MEENTRTRLQELMTRDYVVPPVEDYKQTTQIIMLPVLEEFVSELKKGGHEARVIVDKGIGLVVHPLNREPSIIRFDLSKDKIHVTANNINRGMVDIVSMDPLMVEEHVIAFLEGVFNTIR